MGTIDSADVHSGEVLKFTGSYPHLDCVRALAVSLVFVGHLIHTLGYDHAVGTMAHFGVLLFFVHTSLVLLLSLERKGGDVLQFYVRRLFRIYPLSIVIVFVVVLLHLPDTPWSEYQFHTLGAVAANLALVQNITGHPALLSVLWSLPLEVDMYLLLPLLYVVYLKGFKAVYLWSWSVAISLAVPSSASSSNFLLYGPCFCAGFVAFDLMKKNRHRISFAHAMLGIAALLFLNQALALICKAIPLSLAVEHSLLCIAAGCLIGLSLAPAREQSLFVKSCRVLATYSYGIYLCHFPLMMLLTGHSRSVVRWSVFVLGMIICPVLCFHLIENPMIGVGSVCAKRLSGRRCWKSGVDEEAFA